MQPSDIDIATRQKAAFARAEAFLDGLYADQTLDGRFDRGMTVAIAVMKFIVREQISPKSYLRWMAKMVKSSVVAAAASVEAEAEIEPRNVTWH